MLLKQEEKPTDKGLVNHYSVLNEDSGGIPGSNIGIAEYNNTRYLEPGIHDDQEFFYVMKGIGKARIYVIECDICCEIHCYVVIIYI